MRVLVTGSSGQLGAEVTHASARHGVVCKTLRAC
jgi:dTDP-4-dehydrorhamnose reductase